MSGGKGTLLAPLFFPLSLSLLDSCRIIFSFFLPLIAIFLFLFSSLDWRIFNWPETAVSHPPPFTLPSRLCPSVPGRRGWAVPAVPAVPAVQERASLLPRGREPLNATVQASRVPTLHHLQPAGSHLYRPHLTVSHLATAPSLVRGSVGGEYLH